MEFSVNSPILFVLVGIIIAFVLGQSIFFLVRALKRAKEIGISKKTVNSTIRSSAIFTIAPAIGILIGVLALSGKLGLAVPWLRLSVIGSLSYETVAAEATLKALDIEKVTTASQFVTIIAVMTIGIIIGLILVPAFAKKIQKGFVSIGKKDPKWLDIFSDAMFLGMISAFLGYVVCDVSLIWKTGSPKGFVPVLVFLSSAIIMAVVGLGSKKLKWHWLTDYALPISLIGGMALAIPFTAWLG